MKLILLIIFLLYISITHAQYPRQQLFGKPLIFGGITYKSSIAVNTTSERKYICPYCYLLMSKAHIDTVRENLNVLLNSNSSLLLKSYKHGIQNK